MSISPSTIAVMDRGHSGCPGSAGRRSFTLTELLVAIAIVALLVGLLIAALGQVRSAGRRTTTLATMVAFSSACEQFTSEHGALPGVVSTNTLAYTNHQVVHGDTQFVAMSATENALLGLMGGFLREDDADAAAYAAFGGTEYTAVRANNSVVRFRVNLSRVGDGPRVNGTAYGPYFSPADDDVRVLDARVPQWPIIGGDDGEEKGGGAANGLPDLADAWGRPILMLPRTRDHGPLTGDAHDYATVKPQFYVDATFPYVQAPGQRGTPPGAAGGASLLYGNYFSDAPGAFELTLVRRTLAKLLRSPVSGNVDPLDASVPGTARGRFLLISAGKDRVYFAATDGPGTTSRPIGTSAYTYEAFLAEDRTIFESFDDVVHLGGG